MGAGPKLTETPTLPTQLPAQLPAHLLAARAAEFCAHSGGVEPVPTELLALATSLCGSRAAVREVLLAEQAAAEARAHGALVKARALVKASGVTLNRSGSLKHMPSMKVAKVSPALVFLDASAGFGSTAAADGAGVEEAVLAKQAAAGGGGSGVNLAEACGD